MGRERERVTSRLAWFEWYTRRLDEGVLAPAVDGVAYACPCCRQPTLGERGGFEICPLCGWEDDGQDDPRAEEVWGGPNGRYALAAARRNFAAHGTMYAPDDDSRPPESGGVRSAKRALIEAYDAVRAAVPDAREAAREAVRTAEVALETAKRRQRRRPLP